MIRVDLIVKALKTVEKPTGNEFIDRAKGKYQYPNTLKKAFKLLKYRLN